MVKRLLLWGAGALAVAFVVAQLVPYGRNHANPPFVAEPSWDGPQTRALAVRACYDCHSNETKWPWYSNVAPLSWLAQRDVDEGRATLNFSDIAATPEGAEEAGEQLEEGEMPPLQYVLLHPSAKLSGAERQVLLQGLAATFGLKLSAEEKE